jgi:radical SAM superfamily enzyme YgiQ (UPF0313 family)
MRDTDLRNPAFLKGGEIGSTVKNWEEIDIKIALCDPLPYLVSQGIPACQIMYNIINAEPKGLAERVYLPDGDIRIEINGKREELRSLENKQVVRNFDVIAISIYTEMQYINISWILNAARLNILSLERTEDDPIVIIGGMNLNNPCPLGDIADITFIGESDDFWHLFVELLADCKKKGLNKNDTLKECMKLPGCWVPRFYNEIYDEKGTHTVPAIPEAPKEVVSQIVDLSKRPANDICNAIISNVYDSYAKSLEIARGCRHGCRFPVTGDTKIIIEDEKGITVTRIDEIPIKEWIPQKHGLQVGIFPRDFKIATPQGMQPLTAIWRQKKERVVEFKRLGRTLVKTDLMHLIKVVGGRCKETWAESTVLVNKKIDGLVCIDRLPLNDMEPAIVDLSDGMRGMATWTEDMIYYHPNHRQRTGGGISRFISLNRDFGRWLGLSLGNGNFTADIVEFRHKELETVLLWKTLTERIFKCSLGDIRKKKPNYISKISRKILARALGICSRNGMFIPKNWINSNANFRLGVLEGILSTGNTVESNLKILRSYRISDNLFEQCRVILWSLGIKNLEGDPVASKNPNSRHKNPKRVIYLSKEDIWRLKDMGFEFLDPSKYGTIDFIKQNKPKCEVNKWIPGPIEEIEHNGFVYCPTVDTAEHEWSDLNGLVHHNCLMAYSRRPYRERNAEDIEQALDDRYLKGYHTITLISPNATEFGEIDRIVQSTFDRGLTTKIQTERVDTFTDERLAEVRRESGQVQMTLAIECATEEMRLRINKHITEKQIMKSLEVAIRSGYKWIKFMAMCNLPMESDEDTYELVNLMDRLLIKRDEIAAELGVERPLLFLSVSPFLPKPFTPLQWSALNHNEAKLVELRRRLRDMEGWKGDYEQKGTPRKFTWVIVGCDRHRKINSVFCLGDRRVGHLIEWMFRKKKDIFEKDYQGVKVSTWNDLVIKGNQLGMDIESFYGEKDQEKELPWEFIKMPMTRQFLLDEYENYKTATETLPCDKICSHCGACNILPIAKRPNKEVKKVVRSKDKPNVENWLFIEAVKTEATRFLSYRSIEQILRCLMRNSGITVYRIETSDMKIADSDRLMGKIWIDIATSDINMIQPELFSKYITVERTERRNHRTVYYLDSFTVRMEQDVPISLYEVFKKKDEFNLILDNSGWRRSSNKNYNVIDRINILKATETEVIIKIGCGDTIKVSPYEVASRIAGRAKTIRFRDVEGEIIAFSTKLEFGAESLLTF